MKKKFVSSCIASTILFGTLLGVTYKAEAATVHVAGGVWSHGIGKHYVWSIIVTIKEIMVQQQ